jgi:CubicO group peptidase (beta-lactamase class C family)
MAQLYRVRANIQTQTQSQSELTRIIVKSGSAHDSITTHRYRGGHVSAGFEAVREAFAENFSRRHELGGACCVYHRGEKVVDLWGGVRNKATGEPWEEDTMVLVYSTTKGLAAMTLALAHSRGWLDYEEYVSTYWPEFAQQGKERITVRQLVVRWGQTRLKPCE